MDVKSELKSLATSKHRQFTLKLIPNLDEEQVYGVKSTELKKISRNILKADWEMYLNEELDFMHEEIIIRGMVIANLKINEDKRIELIQDYLHYITNWATCDTFCSQLKTVKKHQDKYWDFICGLDKEKSEYHKRFALIMMKCYYVSDDYSQKVIAEIKKINTEQYYEKMALAWLISELFIKQPLATKDFLKQEKIDSEVLKYCFQKIIDSTRVSEKDKAFVRKLRKV